MTTYQMGADEWYPVVSLEITDSPTWAEYKAEFSDEEIKDLKRVQAEFREWQREIITRCGAKEYQHDNFTLIRE